jgi:hypothetical protein
MLRHRIKGIYCVRQMSTLAHCDLEIEISPARSEYPIELELIVSEKQIIKLPPVVPGQDLRWDLGNLPWLDTAAPYVFLSYNPNAASVMSFPSLKLPLK